MTYDQVIEAAKGIKWLNNTAKKYLITHEEAINEIYGYPSVPSGEFTVGVYDYTHYENPVISLRIFWYRDNGEPCTWYFHMYAERLSMTEDEAKAALQKELDEIRLAKRTREKNERIRELELEILRLKNED